MSVQLINPDGVVNLPVHHQASVATGSRIITLAGQVSWDAGAQLVGKGDLAAQAEQAYHNVATALQGLGASTDDITHVTVYVVGYTRATGKQVMEGRQRAADRLGVDFQHPGTFVGVTSLFDPDYLIEVQATAVVD
ncbi:MAG: RidA family protein [Actinobacteria bacterium]|nr:RidA family protein [Actinomycetota bacterium]